MRLLISWLESPSIVILETKKIKSDSGYLELGITKVRDLNASRTLFSLWIFSFSLSMCGLYSFSSAFPQRGAHGFWQLLFIWAAAAAAAKSFQSCLTLCDPHRWQPTRLPRPWDSPGKNTGLGCHFLLQCMKVKSESEAAQSCLTPSDPMDCSLPGSSVHGIFQARVLEWVAIAF